MNLELIHLWGIVRNRLWLILSIVLLTGIVLSLSMGFSKPSYQARVKLQVSTPEQENVAVFDQYRYIDLREEMTVARNNFIDILKSEEVSSQTISKLALEGKGAEFDLNVNNDKNADFIYLYVRAQTPSNATLIASTLVDEAIAYYGKLRAKPIEAEKELLAKELRVAEEGFRTAQESFNKFKNENNISSLESAEARYQALLEQLHQERDRRILEETSRQINSVDEVDKLIAQRQAERDRLIMLQPEYNVLEENFQLALERYRDELSQNPGLLSSTISTRTAEQLNIAQQTLVEYKLKHGINSLEEELASNQKLLEQLQLDRDQLTLEVPVRQINPVDEVDKLISQRQKELDELASLRSTYNVYQENSLAAQETYQHILNKYNEAELKVVVVQAANFIQIVESAPATKQPSVDVKLLILALAGSLGLGVLSAFALEYYSSFQKEALLPTPASTLETPSSPKFSNVKRIVNRKPSTIIKTK